MQNIDLAAETAMSAARKKIDVDTMLVVSSEDVVARKEMQIRGMEGGMGRTRLRIEVVEGGHWVMLERAGEVNELLVRFGLGGLRVSE